MANERKTEALVRRALEINKYYSDSLIKVEEQYSEIEAVKKLLRYASKTGGRGSGSPEFIISSPSTPDFLIVIECKAKSADHVSYQISEILSGRILSESEDECTKRKQRFAVDGILHYASFLSREFNVIALGISGETRGALQVSSYLWPKSKEQPKQLLSKTGARIEAIIPWTDYIEHATFDPSVQRIRFDELMDFASELHEFMRDHAKLTESEKPLLVSGTLIALRNKAFAASYSLHSPQQLQREWIKVIQEEINSTEIPRAKKENMTQPYSSIAVHPELGKATKAYPKGILHELIDRLNEKVWPFISVYHDFDVVGQFYGEFLKYTGGDKKSLGIVLTPRHVTELFALIANVNKNTKVLDICAGTGGFLISAMHQMMRTAMTDDERTKIKKHGLIGVEQQPAMFALCASNMILRGDGKANLHQGSCFDDAITKAINAFGCDVGMINPPYSQSDTDLHELRFVEHMLDCLLPGGTGIAIVPVGCALASNGLRAELLKKHTLEAVMSMPDDLFYPVGTVTCIMVFTAHKPHALEDRKTWFGYWKRDGFIKTKHKGRIDQACTWSTIRDSWIEAFRNRETHAGLSVMQKVTATDEWCAEAYMDTDYSAVKADDFASTVRNFVAYSLSRNSKKSADDLYPDQSGWKKYLLGDLFEIKKGKRLTRANMIDGETPFIGSIDSNNGVSTFVGQAPIHDGGTITVNYNGSVAEAFYQPDPFWASDDVNVLYPKFKMTPGVAMFIVTIIKLEKYRFNYGRKWHMERMTNSEIKLPSDHLGSPDWKFMEEYIHGIPYGSEIPQIYSGY